MKNRIICSILMGFYISTGIYCKAQSGCSFWFAAPDLEGFSGFDQPIAMVLSTYDLPAQVTISQPANPGFTPIVQNIAANQTVTVDLTSFKADLETQYGDIIQNRGVLVQSTEQITAYYENQNNFEREMFVLKGNNALGFGFYVPFQTWGSNGCGGGGDYCSFTIVATQDSTSITINPTNEVFFSSSVTHPANVPFTRILNTGQTYPVRAYGRGIGDQLNGSYVMSNHAIAITMADDCLHSPIWGTCSDLIGDQIVPNEKSGSLYVIPLGKLDTTAGERAVVLATMNNTAVYFDGSSTPVTTLSAGQSYIVTLPLTAGAKASTIQSNNSINILHVSGYGCEYGGAIVPPINGVNVGSSSVAFARSCPNNELFAVMLICNAGSQGDFTVNGNPGIILSSTFQPVPGTSGAWVEAYADLSAYVTQGQACRINNISGTFHCGVLCGGSGSGCSYGYFTNFYNTVINIDESMQQSSYDLLVYPNPSGGHINILSIYDNKPSDEYTAMIYNSLGKLIQETRLAFNGTYSQLTLDNPEAGIYYLTIMNDQRIIKQQKIIVY